MTKFVERDGVKIFLGDALELYQEWESPIAIISDGACGLGGFPGDPSTPDTLDEWYDWCLDKRIAFS